jgi:hypothetical protein
MRVRDLKWRPHVGIRVRQQAHGGDTQVVPLRKRLAVDTPHRVADHLREQEQVLYQPDELLHAHGQPVQREDEHEERARCTPQWYAIALHAPRLAAPSEQATE